MCDAKSLFAPGNGLVCQFTCVCVCLHAHMMTVHVEELGLCERLAGQLIFVL